MSNKTPRENGGWCRGTGTTHRRWFPIAGALVAMLIAASALGVARPAAAADNGAWSVFPTPNPAARVAIALQLPDGSHYRDSVTITNKTTKRLVFFVYAADARLTANGAFSLAARTDPKLGVAAWIHLPYSSVSLAPRSAFVVPFTIDIPKGTPAGDEPGGIVAEQARGSSTRSHNLQVTTIEAVAARVYLRVAGPLRPALNVVGLHIGARRSLAGLGSGRVDATITYAVRNTGNVRIPMTTAVAAVKPLIGSRVTLPPVVLPELLPNTELRVTQTVRGIDPFGRLQVHVVATAPTVTAHASASTLVIPWLAVLALALLATGFWLLWRRRRKRRNPAAATASPQTPETRESDTLPERAPVS